MLTRITAWANRHKVWAGVSIIAISLSALGALGAIAGPHANDRDSGIASEGKGSPSRTPATPGRTPVEGQSTSIPTPLAPTPTPSLEATGTPPVSAAKPKRSLGHIDVDPAYEQLKYGDADAPYPTTLPSEDAIGSNSAFFSVKGKWKGTVEVPERNRSGHVRCSRWKNDLTPEQSKYMTPDEHIIYEVSTSTGKDQYESLYLNNRGAILRIHRIIDPDDGPSGSDRTFVSLYTATKGTTYSGEGSEEPEPDGTPATKIRYRYGADARTVRFDVNMTLADMNFRFDSGLGPIKVRGATTCKKFSKSPVAWD